MSDLATVVDIRNVEIPVNGKTATIVVASEERNAGTDATLAALLGNLPGTQVTVAGPASPAVTERYGVERVSDTSRRAITQAASGGDTVVVLSPQFTNDFRVAAHFAWIVTQAHMRGQGVALINVTATELTNRSATFFARLAIKNADLTIVRDEQVADTLIAAGVKPPLRIGADPAWSDLGQLFAAPERREHVVVALDDSAENEDVDRLASALSPVAASGVEIVLQPWNVASGSAGQVAEKVADRIEGDVIVAPAPASLKEVRDVYSTSKAVLALRFHALMAAACAGSRTLVLGDDAMNQLANTLGLPVVPPSASPADIATSLLQTLEHGPVGNRAVPQLVDRAKASIDLVRLLLSGGDQTTPTANNPLPLYPEPWRQ